MKVTLFQITLLLFNPWIPPEHKGTASDLEVFPFFSMPLWQSLLRCPPPPQKKTFSIISQIMENYWFPSNFLVNQLHSHYKSSESFFHFRILNGFPSYVWQCFPSFRVYRSTDFQAHTQSGSVIVYMFFAYILVIPLKTFYYQSSGILVNV